MIKKYIFPAFVVFHFGLILLFNFSASIGICYEALEDNKSNQKDGTINQQTKKIESLVSFVSSKIRLYNTYTGANTTYGFFSPKVLNEYFVVYDIRDKQGRTIGTRILPGFKRRESEVRFFLSYLVLQDREGRKQHGEAVTSLANYMLKRIAAIIRADYPGAAEVHVRSYRHDHPKLMNTERPKKPHLIKMDDFFYTFTFNENKGSI